MIRLLFTWKTTIPLCIAAALFLGGALTSIGVPGLYMDSVNPDYLVVRLFNPAAITTPVWMLEGTLIFDRFPIIAGLYSGALPYYLGLPFYALFGTGVFGVRLTHAAFGLLVLGSAAAVLTSFRVRPVISALCLSMLALDPAFLFTFRTQFVITSIPIAATLASIALIQFTRDAPTRNTAFAIGFLAGLACYGYFIYLFYVPTVVAFALVVWRRQSHARVLLAAAAVGLVLAVSPYALAFSLMLWHLGSLEALAERFSSIIQSLKIHSSSLGLFSRVALFGRFLCDTIQNVGPSTMMVGEYVKPLLSISKTIMLIGLPAIVGLLGIAFSSFREAGIYLVGGLILGLLFLVLLFGDRLWLQHASPILPVLYIGLAFAFNRLSSSRLPGFSGSIVAIVCIPFLLANAVSRQDMFQRLETTGGAGLSSDAIIRYAEDSLRKPSNVYRLFPDWGVFMPFVMVTRGSLPFGLEFSSVFVRSLLCAGRDVEVALVTDPSDQRINQWTDQMRWTAPTLSSYSQRDGKPVLTIAYWKAATCVGQ